MPHLIFFGDAMACDYGRELQGQSGSGSLGDDHDVGRIQVRRHPAQHLDRQRDGGVLHERRQRLRLCAFAIYWQSRRQEPQHRLERLFDRFYLGLVNIKQCWGHPIRL